MHDVSLSSLPVKAPPQDLGCRDRRSTGNGPLSAVGFELALGHHLDLLAGIHTGVTLLAVAWPGGDPSPAVLDGVAAALSPLGSVGRLPDGRIAVAYFGPRGRDDSGGRALCAYVRRRLQLRLRELGCTLLADEVMVQALHQWTDRVAGARALIAAVPPAGWSETPDANGVDDPVEPGA